MRMYQVTVFDDLGSVITTADFLPTQHEVAQGWLENIKNKYGLGKTLFSKRINYSVEVKKVYVN